MLIFHKGRNIITTIQVYSVTVMTHGKALQAGQSSQGTSEPITPVPSLSIVDSLDMFIVFGASRQYYTFTKLWAFSAKLKHGDIDATVLGLNLVSGCIRVNKKESKYLICRSLHPFLNHQC